MNQKDAKNLPKTQRRNFLMSKKRYISQRDKGIIDGKTRSQWKAIASKNKKIKNDADEILVSLHPAIVGEEIRAKVEKIRKEREEKQRQIDVGIATLKFVDAIADAVRAGQIKPH